MTEYERLTLILSGVALGVSILTALWTVGWSVWLYLRPVRALLRVSPRRSLWVRNGEPSVWIVSVVVANAGPAAVTITSLRLRLRYVPGNQPNDIWPREWMEGGGLPKLLDVGAAWTAPLLRAGQFARALEGDGLWRWWYGKRWPFDVIVTDATGREHHATFKLERHFAADN